MSKAEGSRGGNDLEHLFGTWLETRGWRYHRAMAVRVPGTRFSRAHDILGCFDFLAVGGPERLQDPRPEKPTGYSWAAQLTVPDKRSARRKKVAAAGPWPASWRVSVVHHLSERVGRETHHWFAVEDYDSQAGVWGELRKVRVDMKEILEYRSNRAALERAAKKADAEEGDA